MTAEQRSNLTSVVIPFIIFTCIWGSTWIVIRDQLGTVPPQWSVAYRFFIAAAAMALAAKVKGHSLRLGREALVPILAIGVTQFCINFNSVYLAERHITSGIVATVFALLLIPNTLLGWAFLGQRPSSRFVWCSLVAIAGIGLLFWNELQRNPAQSDAVTVGIGLTFIEGFKWTPLTIAGALLALGGMIGALGRSRTVVASPDAA